MKKIRELLALKICFANGGQAGNQSAKQIGYKLGERVENEMEIWYTLNAAEPQQ